MDLENKETAAAESTTEVPKTSKEVMETATVEENVVHATSMEQHEHEDAKENKVDEIETAQTSTQCDDSVPDQDPPTEPLVIAKEGDDDSAATETSDASAVTETNDVIACETAPNEVETIATDATSATAMEVTDETPVIQSNVLLVPAPAVPMVESDQEAQLPMEGSANTVPTGLSLLAQYDSDDDAADSNSAKESDTESVIEVPTTGDAQKDYRTQVVEINSDSDDSSSDSDVEYLSKIRKQIDKSIAAGSDDDDDDDDEDGDKKSKKGQKRQPPKVKGEMLLDDLPPIQDLHITVPEAECVELGRVHSVVDQLMLVSVLPNSVLLDLDTVLFLERGQKVLGAVFDVLGQVADPMYCVRFNSHAQIVERGISVGDTVYVAPKTEYTQFVILSSLMKMRGSDASWENDIEPPPRYVEYSDDEQERDARNERKEQRNKDRPNDHEDTLKRARAADSSADEAANFAPQRGRGGRGGNYRAPRRQPFNAPSPSPPPQGYSNQYHQQQQHQQRPNYNSNYNPGSWHSNFYQPPPHHRAGPPPQQNYGMPPPLHHNHQNPLFSSPPPPFNNAYGMPPQRSQQQHSPQSMYVPNPYAMRPPVLPPNGGGGHQRQMQQSMYTTPPPPPPGAQ